MRDRPLLTMLVSIGVLAAIVYTASAAIVGPQVVLRDAFAYNASAQRLLNTGAYDYNPDLTADVESTSGPNAFTMPGYTLFLSAIYLFLPHSGDVVANILVAQPKIIFVQLLLAVTTAVVIARAGRSLGGAATGWTAGVMAVAYIPFGMNATVSLTETLALFLSALVVLGVVEMFSKKAAADRTVERRAMILYGVAGGLSVLVRPVVAAWLIVPIGVWVLTRRKELGRAVRLAAVGCLCIVALLAPWIVRNAIVLGEFIPLTASASTPLLDSVGGADFTEAEEELMERASAAGEDPILAVALERLKVKWLMSPWGFIRWKLATIWDGLLNFANLPQDVALDISYEGLPKEGTYADAGKSFPLRGTNLYLPLFDLITFYHRALLLLAAAGLALGWRRRVMWTLASMPLYYLVVHTAVLLRLRYLYPYMPVVILLAAFGAVGAYLLVAARLQWSSRTDAPA